MVSDPQSVHVLARAVEYLPGVQATSTELPVQEDPAGHGEHTVRVEMSPPDVMSPALQALHRGRPSVSEYRWSCPQSEQTDAPTEEYRPGAQGVAVEVPSQKEPPGHNWHLVCPAVAPLPEVAKPTEQSLQLVAPMPSA